MELEPIGQALVRASRDLGVLPVFDCPVEGVLSKERDRSEVVVGHLLFETLDKGSASMA